MKTENQHRPIVVFITASGEEEALKIGQNLVEKKLAACANVVPGLQSIFYWKGELCEEAEVLLIIKSSDHLLDRIISFVQKLHSYDVPEIIALPVVGGSEEYLKWIEASLI